MHLQKKKTIYYLLNRSIQLINLRINLPYLADLKSQSLIGSVTALVLVRNISQSEAAWEAFGVSLIRIVVTLLE